MSDGITRRELFGHAAVYGGSLWLAIAVPRPRAAAAAGQSTTPAVLDPAGWRIVEAITGRILPSDGSPGAIEAGCVNFIDKALAHEDSMLVPLYEAGLVGIERIAKKRFEKTFVELSPEEQDTILVAVEAGDAPGWPEGPVTSPQFFEAVRIHTLIGFLADPRYGGNRDYVGWKLVGYPGPRHREGGYTPEQMLGDVPIRGVWGGRI